ncbi:MAG TPA: bifunctional 4-hydroxy-2-oxoglutarate aldolase/2-dehydro-3-deoxy-phosphogluconate aldolase [Acholeplasmataceae bacterium]|jgi:2-dehydro-3-deoxyphosphogluconate aldolase/(4S)-4-hydroxy-2-oxoglutarate aldolase|nr:bifunctional 4-hydroxy-2-oxoglutarate aldolase/2-dehydro-3-deoxy-phosphogluconate aldolase [Acholeplasmataceae bacterium]
MRKLEVLQRMVENGITAVVRAKNEEEAEKIATACIAGGISSIEITFTVSGAENVISSLRKKFSKDELIVGAGTVLDAETARLAILRGAEFIVSPAFNPEVAALCNRYQVPYIPGCMTIKEIITAMEAGADIIKLFPGSALGPDFVKAVKGPLPQANLMPTGGVSLDNVQTWIKNGCVAVGVGGELTAPAKTGNFEKITELARSFVQKIKEAREAQ